MKARVKACVEGSDFKTSMHGDLANGLVKSGYYMKMHLDICEHNRCRITRIHTCTHLIISTRMDALSGKALPTHTDTH